MATETQNTDKKDVVSIYRNDAFDSGFYEYFKNIKNNKISGVLNNKDRNVKFESITYRQLNSWDSQGLLNTKRESKGWRKFSIVDAIWIKIIDELRGFGFSWEQISVTKKSLEFGQEKCKVTMPMLEFYTAFAIGNKMPVLLLVFKDGTAVPANFHQYKIANQYAEMENHLQINLNGILQKFFPKVDLIPSYKADLPVSVNEMELLAYLRITNFESITVKFNNGEMEKFEGVKRLKAKKRIEEIMREHNYQNITIQEEDGKVTAVFQTIKKKFTKGSNPK